MGLVLRRKICCTIDSLRSVPGRASFTPAYDILEDLHKTSRHFDRWVFGYDDFGELLQLMCFDADVLGIASCGRVSRLMLQATKTRGEIRDASSSVSQPLDDLLRGGLVAFVA